MFAIQKFAQVSPKISKSMVTRLNSNVMITKPRSKLTIAVRINFFINGYFRLKLSIT